MHRWWEYKFVKPLGKTSWSFLKKLKIELPWNPTTLILSSTLSENKSINLKRYLHAYIRSSTSYDSQDVEPT